VVSWKEAGLGDNLNIDYTASATATRVDSCVNNGQNIPADPKKTTNPVARDGQWRLCREERAGHREPDDLPAGDHAVLPEGADRHAHQPLVHQREDH